MRSNQEQGHTTPAFAARVVRQRNCPCVVVQGEIDLAAAAEFHEALKRACDGAARIEVDMRDATFMDSTGIMVLLQAHQRLGQLPEAIVLHDPHPTVLRVLDLAGVADLFTVHTTTPSQASQAQSDH